MVVTTQQFQTLPSGHLQTSIMLRELQEAGDHGFEYRVQTVVQTAFGGKEVVVILERDRERKALRYRYRLLATKKTSSLQKELSEMAEKGFEFVRFNDW